MVDAGGSEEFWPHRFKWALDRSRMLSEYGVAWFEEPLPPDDLEGFVMLRESSPVPIATGEALTRRQSFQPLLERRAVDVVQPDTTKVGGLSEARRIAWAAYDSGITLVSHGWNTAIGVAADLHLAAAMPLALFVEYQVDSPYIDGLAARQFHLDDQGFLTVPSSPGLGVELDPDAVERLSHAP
jgi:L-alanine-DL-glutamate epimerase-like enolase superfamily enzyme